MSCPRRGLGRQPSSAASPMLATCKVLHTSPISRIVRSQRLLVAIRAERRVGLQGTCRLLAGSKRTHLLFHFHEPRSTVVDMVRQPTEVCTLNAP